VSNSNGAVTSRAVILAVAPVDPIAVALNDTTLPVSNDLSSAWFTQTDVTHDGLAAAQSGAIGDYGESALATSVKGPGDVRFWWKISAAPRAFLEVSVDDVASVCLTGEVDWTEQSLTLREGMHSIRWRFHKLDAGYEGADAAWVDEVSTFTESPPTNQPPALTSLAGQWKYPGETCAFVAEAKGTAPFTYGWYRDGGPIEGQTGATLTVVADYPAAGEYSVVVSNAFGGDYSAARLVVAPVFYAMEDLGTLWPGPESESAAYGLNNRGDVVGYGVDAGSGARRACVWSGGTGTALTNPLGDADSLAYAINDAGDVVGTAAEPGGTNYHAICWRKTDSGYVADDLGRSNWPSAFGRSINNAGDIVIAMSDGPYKRRTLLWREGAMLSLNGLAPPWTNDVGDTSGWGLNSIGYVAGSAGTLTNGHWILRAWLYNGVYRRNMHDGGPIPNIPHVGAEGMSGGYAVNDFNDMAGLYGNILYSWMGAYVFSETNLFRAERYVYALNNCGDILVETGSDLALRCSTNARAPARLADGRPDYADHRLFSLKDLVPGGADPFVDLRIRLDVFGRMNHAREIASQGTTTGSVKRAVLLRPLPRPGNTAPVAQDDTVINSGVGLIIPLDALLANDSDADGDALALLTADGRSAQNATIRRSRNRLVYTPGGGLADPDTFRYLIQDFRGGVATGTVTVLMWPVGNTPPVNELKLFRVPGWAPFVRFRASPGETWRLQVCDDLEEDEWTTIGTAIAGADAVVDSGDLFLYTAPHRYYRAVSP
jgi:hypothetical protein